MKTRATVLLYNPLSGHGHLDSWNAMFARILLDLGYTVLALTPDRRALAGRLEAIGFSKEPGLEILDWNAQPKWLAARNSASRLFRWWWISSESYGLGKPGTLVQPGDTLWVRRKKRVLQWVIPPLYRATRWLAGGLAERLGLLDPDSPQDCPETGLLDPEDCARRMSLALAAAGHRPDFVFNMYLDMYKSSPARWRAFAECCPLPWGGIRFVPQGADRPEAYFSLPGMRGLCFLDERARDDYAATGLDKVLAVLPDIVSVHLPASPPLLVTEIRQRAGGRKVVFLGGSIGGQKNLARWAGLIRRADASRFFFVQAGEIHTGGMNAEERAALQGLMADTPANLFIHPHYLESDADFDAVVAASDVIFAVYRDFRISSNMPGKAAHLEKPILVAEGHLMGARVTRYGIGRSVPEKDEEAMLAALEDLAAAPIPAAHFAAYRRDFSHERMAEELETFIEACLQTHMCTVNQ